RRRVPTYPIAVAAGRLEKVLDTDHTDTVVDLALSPDGRWLASAGSDSTAEVWDVATGQRRQPLKGHTDEVRGVAFSPDSQTLATASSDHTVRLWPLAGRGPAEPVQLRHD